MSSHQQSAQVPLLKSSTCLNGRSTVLLLLQSGSSSNIWSMACVILESLFLDVRCNGNSNTVKVFQGQMFCARLLYSGFIESSEVPMELIPQCVIQLVEQAHWGKTYSLFYINDSTLYSKFQAVTCVEMFPFILMLSDKTLNAK